MDDLEVRPIEVTVWHTNAMCAVIEQELDS
jgi:hypothetical protein